MPPVVLADLLAFHCSEQVWSRPLNAVSLENFASTADGYTAGPAGAAGGAAGVASLFGFAAASLVAGGVAAGAAAASDPHSALRKSFQLLPLRLPAVLAD